MACWEQDDQPTALTHFERAVRLMQETRPGNLDLQKLQAEVQAVLGLTQTLPPAVEASGAASQP